APRSRPQSGRAPGAAPHLPPRRRCSAPASASPGSGHGRDKWRTSRAHSAGHGYDLHSKALSASRAFHKLRNNLTETAEDRVPTYQYACTECGHFFEQFQSFTDDALTEGPVCSRKLREAFTADALTDCPGGSGKLRKVFNAVGVLFKGSGFYRNDSRAPSSEKSEGGSK